MEERICGKFFRGGEMTDEEEEMLIDFLYNKGIQVNMNTTKKKLCILTLEKKLGSREKLKQFYKDAKNREELFQRDDLISNLNNEVYDPNKYGNLTLDAFLKRSAFSSN